MKWISGKLWSRFCWWRYASIESIVYQHLKFGKIIEINSFENMDSFLIEKFFELLMRKRLQISFLANAALTTTSIVNYAFLNHGLPVVSV